MTNIRAEIYTLAAAIHDPERPSFPKILKFMGQATVGLSGLAEVGLLAAGVNSGATLTLPLCTTELGAGMWFVGHAGSEKS